MMLEEFEKLERFIAVAGSKTAAAKLFGIPGTNIQNWYRSGRIPLPIIRLMELLEENSQQKVDLIAAQRELAEIKESLKFLFDASRNNSVGGQIMSGDRKP